MKYETPKMEIYNLCKSDIITTSGLIVGGDGTIEGDDTVFPASMPYNE